MPYKILEMATADVAFEARGKTIEELFVSSAKATTEVMVKLKTIKEKIKKEFSVKGKDPEQLLFNFLQEIVYIKDADLLIFRKFSVEIKKNTSYALKCTAYGDKLNATTQEHGVDVKAVTYHLFKVGKEKNFWKAFVILDI